MSCGDEGSRFRVQRIPPVKRCPIAIKHFSVTRGGGVPYPALCQYSGSHYQEASYDEGRSCPSAGNRTHGLPCDPLRRPALRCSGHNGGFHKQRIAGSESDEGSAIHWRRLAWPGLIQWGPHQRKPWPDIALPHRPLGIGGLLCREPQAEFPYRAGGHLGHFVWNRSVLVHEPDCRSAIGSSEAQVLSFIDGYRPDHTHDLRRPANLAHYSVVLEIARTSRSLRRPSRMIARSRGLATLRASTSGWIVSAGSVFCMKSLTCCETTITLSRRSVWSELRFTSPRLCSRSTIPETVL